MSKVLVHPHGSRPRSARLYSCALARLLLSLFVLFLATSGILIVAAEGTGDGSSASQSVSRVETPTSNSVLHAGSETDISIDVHMVSASNATLGIDFLELYLVSSGAQKNLTVSSGPGLLTQEPGSDVKHIHFTVPTCLQTGVYNLTAYETSHFNNASYFAIIPIPVQIQNEGNVTDPCNATLNAYQAGPQPSNPLPANVLPDRTGSIGNTTPSASPGSSTTDASSTESSIPPSTNTGTATVNGTTTASSDSAPSSSLPTPPPSGGGIITVTAGDGEITIPLSSLPGTIVVEPSGGAPSETVNATGSGFTTIFRTVAPTATATLTQIISAPVTITLEETSVSTSTAPGTTEEFTVTQTVLSTTAIVTTQVITATSPQQVGLLPINSGTPTLIPALICSQWTLAGFAFMYVVWPLFSY
ncbi:hypothetical protein BD413DRAFT_98379 [Trametes elegans]|nr:hypothetical protein BD413DRAFT_98379 [Trametes elegans]